MIELRLAEPADYAGVFEVEMAAFGQADEARLVERLRERGEVDFECVARSHGTLVGHILFSPLLLSRQGETLRGSALAPLAVRPEWQKKGVGSALVRMGLEFCASLGVDVVVVVGEPAYYSRFGFDAELGRLLEAPFPYPYLQVVEMENGVLSGGGWAAGYASSFLR
jgi:putative acetyltransferase